jgi:KDO2-lipid IV(A) lauroyltransferase
MGVFFYKLGAFLARLLPIGLSEAITDLLVKIQFIFRVRSRRAVIGNLRLILHGEADEKTLRAKARRVFLNFGRSILMFLYVPAMDRHELRQRCDYNGIDSLAAELSEQGGFIIVGPHLGPWEVGGGGLAALELPIHTVAFHHPSTGVTRFFEESRRKMGVKTSHVRNAYTSLRDALNRGDCVVLLIDRAYEETGKPFQMFGRQVELPTGHLALALRCGVPVITAACVIGANGQLQYTCNGPYRVNTSVDEETAMSELQQSCIEDIEDLIRTHHEQWFHFFPLEQAHHERG